MEYGDWVDKDYGKRFPGAGWMRQLNGPQIVWSGPTVLSDIIIGRVSAKDVIVIQEENNEHGQELVGLGADPRIQMCLESPIFASKFYDNIPPHFKHLLLFSGGTEHIYFPSFDDEDLKDPVPWNDRKFLCMVTSNKHYCGLPIYRDNATASYMTPETYFRSGAGLAFPAAMKTQLHDYRYQAIDYFKNSSGFHLYGRGWDGVHPCIVGECADKLATIRQYKFALCFENGSYPGYVTEKIIDCLVAGVIPVYMGAPDIEQWIPQNLFLDARRWTSFAEMENFLKHYVGIDPEAKIAAGQQWVKSSPYNNRVFAKRILEMCE